MLKSVWTRSCLLEDSRTSAGSQAESLSGTQTLEPLRRVMVKKTRRMDEKWNPNRRVVRERKRKKEWDLRVEVKWNLGGSRSNGYNYESKKHEWRNCTIFISFSTRHHLYRLLHLFGFSLRLHLRFTVSNFCFFPIFTGQFTLFIYFVWFFFLDNRTSRHASIA